MKHKKIKVDSIDKTIQHIIHGDSEPEKTRVRMVGILSGTDLQVQT